MQSYYKILLLARAPYTFALLSDCCNLLQVHEMIRSSNQKGFPYFLIFIQIYVPYVAWLSVYPGGDESATRNFPDKLVTVNIYDLKIVNILQSGKVIDVDFNFFF